MAQWSLAFLSPLLAAVLVHALLKPAHRFGLVDHPGGRKDHQAPTPLVGGLAIITTVVGLQLLAGTLPFESLSLLFAVGITLAVGLADDAHEIGHRSKFFAQIAAALVVASGTGEHMTHFGDLFGLGPIELGKWSHVVTVISIIGLMNAINMIDGLDGLAGSIVVPPLVVYTLLALDGSAESLAFEILLLAGAIVGFLYYNLRSPWRPRALAFMGDTGGMLLGLLLAWYSIKFSGTDESAISPITAVWILAVPLLDMGSVMLLRVFQRKSPFHADRQHMHHVLLSAGYSVGQVVAIMSFVSLLAGALAVYAERTGVPESTLFAAFIACWGMYFAALAKPHHVRAVFPRVLEPKGESTRM